MAKPELHPQMSADEDWTHLTRPRPNKANPYDTAMLPARGGVVRSQLYVRAHSFGCL